MIRVHHASLADATAAALAAIDRRTVLLEHGGQQYVLKRAADRPRSVSQALAARWLAKLLTGCSLPMKSLLLAEAASRVGYEASRIEKFASAGVRVPHIVSRGAGYLLLEHCGVSVANSLEGWSADHFRREFDRLAQELGAFHRAGHWHGAAQIKNLTLKDGQTFRIDFEEDFGELLPLPAAQALDVVLFLNSISLAGPVAEAESRLLLPQLLNAYFAANPDLRVREVLERALPWLAAVARLASPLRKWNYGGHRRKGAARVVILADALSSYLN